jgi:predicted nucleotidyltransferase
MITKRPPRQYGGPDIPMRVIRGFARKVVERFGPDKIILFGSFAYGKPNADSDVDILVIMPCRNELDQSFKIRLAVAAPFPMDLIVRTPRKLRSWLEERESFHTEVVNKGVILYEKENAGMDQKSRRRFSACTKHRTR